LFLKYFVAHHISRTLDTLNRQFHAIAALSGDPESNRSDREAVKLYLHSLPSPPYRVLIFAADLVALVIALPMQAFGNVFYVIDLVGAVLRFDVGYVGRAFAGSDLGPTVRSLIVLLFGLVVVAAVLTSPFGLKRILFNLYPQGEERLDRGQEPRASGSEDSISWKTGSLVRSASSVPGRGGGILCSTPSCSCPYCFSASAWCS
jgi:hypothetical protein